MRGRLKRSHRRLTRAGLAWTHRNEEDSLVDADAAAQRVAQGALGQVDLEHFGNRIVYSVDVGSQEVCVDVNSGIVVDIRPRD